MPARAGFGGVIRFNDGQWLFSFSSSLGNVSVSQTELEAMQKGLAMAYGAGH